MVKIKRELVLATCLISGIASVISLVSLGTNYWITAEVSTLTIRLWARLGLFSGSTTKIVASEFIWELEITCLFDKNICGYLSGGEEARYNSLEELYNKNDNFLNAGVWLCTLLFLVLSAVFGLLAAGLSMWNTVTNPIQSYLSIFGIYIYNAIAAICGLFVLLLWGIHYNTTLIHNIPILETLNGDVSTDNHASLGYSYWINIASLFLYLLSNSILYIRDYLISKNPKVEDIHMEDSRDPGIYLY